MIRDAVALSDRRIIGSSSARSPDRRARPRTDDWFRYASISIAFSTDADGNVDDARDPHSRAGVRTWNATVPRRSPA
jgi:hypothetical protein